MKSSGGKRLGPAPGPFEPSGGGGAQAPAEGRCRTGWEMGDRFLGCKPHRSSVSIASSPPPRPARRDGRRRRGGRQGDGSFFFGPGGGATLPCRSLSSAVVSRAEDERARASAVLARGRGAGRACSRGVARTGAGEPGARPGGVPRDAFLTPAEPRTPARRPQVARLETRTKESDAHASGEGNNPILNRVVKARIKQLIEAG